MRLNLALPLIEKLDALIDKLNASLSELQDRLLRVPEISRVNGTSKDGTSGGANAVTSIAHTMGAVPSFVHIEPQGNATWWVTPAERATWTKTRIYVRFSAADINFTGYVSRLE